MERYFVYDITYIEENADEKVDGFGSIQKLKFVEYAIFKTEIFEIKQNSVNSIDSTFVSFSISGFFLKNFCGLEFQKSKSKSKSKIKFC